MRGTPSSRPYALLAKYYDQFFADYRPVVAAARGRLLGDILPRIGSACDLGCGTGDTALELARQGLDVFAVDLCPEMCALARRKARRAHLPLRVIQADMRTFRLPERVDLVTCEFDALNHVPQKANLASVGKAVARALRPGGHFYFDVNNRLAFEKAWPGSLWIEKPGVVIATHGGFDRGRDKAFLNVEMFIRDGRCWQRFRQRVEEVCWTATEIREALRQAGFDRIRAWDAKPFFEGNSWIRPGYRTFYLARRVTLPASGGGRRGGSRSPSSGR